MFLLQLFSIALILERFISEMKENERQGTQNNKVEMGEPNFETDLPKVSNSDQVHLLDSNSDSTEYSRHLEVNNLTVNPENLNISESCKIYTGNDDLEEKFKNKSNIGMLTAAVTDTESKADVSDKITARREIPVPKKLVDDRVVKERAKRQKRYLSRREEKIEKQREYYSKNRERMVEKQADYYKANRQEVIARQYEYYQKNKTKITEKKRQWYQEKRGFISNKKVMHPSLVESISPTDPTSEGCGVVKIKHLRTIINKFNKEMNKKWKIVYDVQSGSDLISNCTSIDNQKSKPGLSKLNSLSETEIIMTLPPGYAYRGSPLAPSDLAYVESFVALAVSKDDESLDMRYLLHKENITLEGMRDLFHAIQSTLDIDMHDFMTEKQSLFFINPTCLSNPVLKNRFCKQVGIYNSNMTFKSSEYNIRMYEEKCINFL